MGTLYKYSGDLGVDFIDNPTMKLSIPSKLNDPFECDFSTDFINYLKKCLKGGVLLDEEQPLLATKIVLKHIGIISLSETHRNSLMWAHYANEHSGICLGIDNDFLRNKKDFVLPLIENDKGLTGRYIPEKVNYDNARFDVDAHEPIFWKKFSSARGFQELLFKQLSIKSDEWIYEKEHRAIVPINYADEILINKSKCSARLAHSLATYENKGEIEKISDFRYGILKDGFFSTLAIMCQIHEKGSMSLLCKIPFKSIRSLYLGVNYSNENKSILIEKLNTKNHPLSHIKVFQKIVSRDRFELNSKLIYPPES